MSRQIVKTISNAEIEFIPDDMKDMDRNHSDMLERPIIVYGKKMTNEQKWKLRELISTDTENGKMLPGTGDALKYIWENCITRVLNVVSYDDNQNRVDSSEIKGKEKNDLWNTLGMESVLYSAVTFFQNQSEFTDEESKT